MKVWRRPVSIEVERHQLFATGQIHVRDFALRERGEFDRLTARSIVNLDSSHGIFVDRDNPVLTVMRKVGVHNVPGSLLAHLPLASEEVVTAHVRRLATRVSGAGLGCRPSRDVYLRFNPTLGGANHAFKGPEELRGASISHYGQHPRKRPKVLKHTVLRAACKQDRLHRDVRQMRNNCH